MIDLLACTQLSQGKGAKAKPGQKVRALWKIRERVESNQVEETKHMCHTPERNRELNCSSWSNRLTQKANQSLVWHKVGKSAHVSVHVGV